MPSIATAIILGLVLRAVLSSQRGGKTQPVFWNSWALPTLALRVTFVSAAAVLAGTGHWGWWLAFMVLIVPEWVIGWMLVPAGIPYVTYYFARATWPQTTSNENRGGAVFDELRARVRRGRSLALEGQNALAARLFRTRTPRGTRGASLAARAILDAVGGDFDGARALFAVVQDMRPQHAARRVRKYCQAWLLADAARRGAYHELVRSSTYGPRTARRRFMRGCALRLLGVPSAPRPIWLWLAWLSAPARRHGFALLRRSLDSTPRTPLLVTGQGLEAATNTTAALLRLQPGIPSRSDLRTAASTWQAVFDGPELRDRLVRRQSELEFQVDHEVIRAKLEADVVTTLARLWRNTLPDHPSEAAEPPLILAAKDALQDEWLTELEALVRVLPQGDDDQSRPLEEHWRRWAEVRRVARDFLDALPDRYGMLFGAVGSRLLNHGVWLHTHENATLLAHDVFRWLLPLSPPTTETRKILIGNVASAEQH